MKDLITDDGSPDHDHPEAQYFELTEDDLMSADQTVVTARNRDVPAGGADGDELPKIGEALGGRDHTTVMQDRKIRQLLSQRRER